MDSEEKPKIVRIVLFSTAGFIITYFSVWTIMYSQYEFVRTETHLMIESTAQKISFAVKAWVK